jgi:hypothetical protein
MANSKILGATLVLCAAFCASAEAALYKWVDDQGVTQYGEVIPPEYADKVKVKIEKGREVKEKVPEAANVDPSKRTPEQQAAIEQNRRDKALINTYSNEKEIDLARDRNLQQVEANIDGIRLMQKSAQERLDGFNQEASATKQAGKPIPASLQADIANAQDRMVRLKRELVTAGEKAASVKASFEADKARYRGLISGSIKN